MYHPLLLQAEVIREFPALLDDRNAARVEHAAEPAYRSEAFAEDLPEAERLPPAVAAGQGGKAGGRAKLVLLWAAPIGAAVFGGAMSLLGMLH